MNLFEFVEPCDAYGDMAVWHGACTANRIAKLCTGSTQRLLYEVKNRCLLRLSKKGSLEIAADNALYPGLLSVKLRRGRGRLHTHENWMEGK